MKSDFFDYFTYKIILSIPISFIANSVYSIMLFAALLASNTHGYNSTLNMGYFIFIMLMYIKAVFPFMIFNLFRYWAVSKGRTGYGKCGYLLSISPIILILISVMAVGLKRLE